MKVTVQRGSITNVEYVAFKHLTTNDEFLFFHLKRRSIMQRIFVAVVLVPLLMAFVAGCSMLAEPEWSENYALEAQCSVPKMSDGSMYSSGETQTAEYIRGQRADDSRYNDIILTFKEPKLLRRIVLRRRSEDNVAVDVNVFVMADDKWEQISDTTRGDIRDDVGIAIRTTTSQLKIRVQRAVRSKGKSAIVAGSDRTGRQRNMERVLRQPVKFAEVEVYGLKPKTETKES